MPAAASSSSFIWRCVALAGCSTQVRASVTRGYLRQLEVRHERLGRGAPAGHAEVSHHTAGVVRQVLLRQLVLVVARQAGVAHPGDLRMRGQMLRQRQTVLAVLRHAQVQAFQPQVDEVGVLRRLDEARSRA